MRIMIDTNILLSVILFPSVRMVTMMDYITKNHSLVLCSHIIDEIRSVFKRKFPDDISTLEKFLRELSYELENTPYSIDQKEFPVIRDRKDLPILVSAILSEVDILITGDKDFWEVGIDKPEIFNPIEFTKKFLGG
jgi:putative PIN family toxin of toxin-antitoxin system